MVNKHKNLKTQSFRLLLAFNALFSFDIWTTDIFSAIFRASQPLEAYFFINNAVAEFDSG